MKFSHTLLLLLISINLWSQTVPKFEHFKIDLNAPKINFFDAIEHVEVIRLEETDNSLLSSIEWYFKTPNGIAIPIRYKKPFRIALFDKNGNYQSTINRFGEGPDEYLDISSASFINGAIELFSGSSRILQRYTESGKFIETIKTNYDSHIWGGQMIPYKNGYILHQRDGSGPLDHYEYYALVFVDSDLSVIKKTSKITNPSQIPGASGRNLMTVDSETYYHKHMSDSIFLIKDETAYPRFKLDFGDKWAWENPKNNESIQRAMKMFLNEEGIAVMVNSFINKDYIFLSYYQGIRNEQKGYIDRKSGRFYCFDMSKGNGENYDLNFLEWEDNSLVSSLQSYDFEEFIENLDEDQWTVRGGFKLSEILYSENPVLLKIKFK